MNLKKYVPEFYFDDPNLIKIIEVFEAVFENAYQQMQDLISHRDILVRDSAYLKNYIKERGWALDLDLNDIQQRKLLQFVIQINKSRGTTQCIIDTIKLLYNIQLSETLLTPELLGYWVLDYSELGYNTEIADVGFNLFPILLSSNSEPDEETKKSIKKIVGYLRAVTMKYILSWEQEAIENIDRTFILDISELEYSTEVN